MASRIPRSLTAEPAIRARRQFGSLSHLQNRYAALRPSAAAGTSGITNAPCPRTVGLKHHRVNASQPAGWHTTQFYDRHDEELTVQEIEKVLFERLDVEVGGFDPQG